MDSKSEDLGARLLPPWLKIAARNAGSHLAQLKIPMFGTKTTVLMRVVDTYRPLGLASEFASSSADLMPVARPRDADASRPNYTVTSVMPNSDGGSAATELHAHDTNSVGSSSVEVPVRLRTRLSNLSFGIRPRSAESPVPICGHSNTLLNLARPAKNSYAVVSPGVATGALDVPSSAKSGRGSAEKTNDSPDLMQLSDRQKANMYGLAGQGSSSNRLDRWHSYMSPAWSPVNSLLDIADTNPAARRHIPTPQAGEVEGTFAPKGSSWDSVLPQPSQDGSWQHARSNTSAVERGGAKERAALPPVDDASTVASEGLFSPLSQGAVTSASEGDLYLDGTLVGRWMTELLGNAAGRPPSGSAAFDPIRNRLPIGTMIGL